MIAKQEVVKIAELARLSLTKEEEKQFQKDLSEVLDYFEVLKKAPVKDVEPMAHAVVAENVAREDVALPERPEVVNAMLQLLPNVKDGYLKVKAILKRS